MRKSVRWACAVLTYALVLAVVTLVVFFWFGVAIMYRTVKVAFSATSSALALGSRPYSRSSSVGTRSPVRWRY